MFHLGGFITPKPRHHFIKLLGCPKMSKHLQIFSSFLAGFGIFMVVLECKVYQIDTINTAITNKFCI